MRSRKDKFRPYLLQRLEEPNTPSLNDCALGFNEDTLNSIKNIFSFDYMGSSEFEWGALPNAFQALSERVNKENFVATQIEVDVLPNPWDPNISELPDEKKQTVYIIAPESDVDNVSHFIEEIAINEGPDLLEMHLFNQSVFAPETTEKGGYARQIKGWFDLRNSFFFFIDEAMFENTKIGLGMEQNNPAPAPKKTPAYGSPKV